MKPLKYPGNWKEDELNDESIQMIRHRAREAELRGSLHPAQWQLVREKNWLNIYLPTSLKGRGVPFQEALELLEQLAYTDGALGWTVTLCSGAHWFLGFLDPTLRFELLMDDELCITGSGEAGGRVEKMDKGFWAEGEWPHASGAGFATHLTANCKWDDKTYAFVFRKAEAALFSNWTTMGMKATASHGFRVKHTWIPENRLFEIDPARATDPDPIFQIPFELLAACTLAVNITGMTIRFDELAAAYDPVSTSNISEGAGVSIRGILEKRSRLFKLAGYHPDTIYAAETEESMRLAKEITALSISRVQQLYNRMSLYAAKEETEINRIWRNLHTAALHPVLRSRQGLIPPQATV